MQGKDLKLAQARTYTRARITHTHTHTGEGEPSEWEGGNVLMTSFVSGPGTREPAAWCEVTFN